MKKPTKTVLRVGKNDVLLIRFEDVPDKQLEAFRAQFVKAYPHLANRAMIVSCPAEMMTVTVIKDVMRGKK